MVLWEKISYLWNRIFDKKPAIAREEPYQESIYQRVIDDDIIELEISERIIELLLEHKTLHLTTKDLEHPEEVLSHQNVSKKYH